MASFLRLAARHSSRLLTSNCQRQRQVINPACFISTSNKKKDSAAVSEIADEAKVETRYKENEDNFISYGYSLTDRDEDRFTHHVFLFFGITLSICWGGFILAYRPDHRLQEWTQREAYLELTRREKNGMPLVDKNFIDASKISLPSDDELGDYDIII